MKEVLTPQEAKKIFDYANKAYFNNELKPIPIKVISGPGRIASYSWLKDKGKIVKRVMFITDSYKMEKEYFVNVVVHEMIHYYLHVKYNKNMKHGKIWQETVNYFNKTYGLNISKKPDPSAVEYTGDTITAAIHRWLLRQVKRLVHR